MIHILYTKITIPFPEPLYQKYLSLLPKQLQEKNGQIKLEKDRVSNLLGKVLLLEGLKKIGMDGLYLENLKYNRYNRPYLSGNLDFNISHSGEYVLCAIGKDVKLGIDIEEIKPVSFPDFEDIMTHREWEVIGTSADQLKAFITFWTIKESVVKADNRGLFIPLREIYISENMARCYGDYWFLKVLDINSNYCACLATDLFFDQINIEYRQL
ncbi:4'-phosphopantetheinyl transferase family protein [Flavitalea flava]